MTSTAAQPYALATLSTASVTSQFLAPALSVRLAICAASYARLHDVAGRALGLVRKNNRLGVRDGVAVHLDTQHHLDDVLVLEHDLGVRRQGREVRNDVVDRDRSGEGET